MNRLQSSSCTSSNCPSSRPGPPLRGNTLLPTSGSFGSWKLSFPSSVFGFEISRHRSHLKRALTMTICLFAQTVV
ncbi:hypothetical protein BDW69DRAFT_166524 [Aspergillus filifer]